MQAGDLVLVQGTHFVERAIQIVEEGGFNHVALAISDSEVIEAQPSGVQKVQPYYERYAVYECIGITDEQRQKAVAYAYSALGDKYNFLQDAEYLIEFFTGKPLYHSWRNHGKLICSSLADLSLRSGGFILREDREAGNISPMGCIYTPKVRLIENHNLWEV